MISRTSFILLLGILFAEISVGQIAKPGYQAPAKKTTPVYNGPKKLSGNSEILIVFDAKGTLKVDYQLIGSFNSGEAYNSPIGAGAHIITYSNGTCTWESTVENKSGQQLIVKTELQVQITAGEERRQAELRAAEEARRAEAARKAEAARRGSFTDSRDGQVYSTIKIDDQVWMSENLNFETADSWCYYCQEYGRLYTWEAATKGCPTGWHLPSIDEWSTLVTNYDGANLREGGSSGFNASFGGSLDQDDGKVLGLGKFGYYWSSSVLGENFDEYKNYAWRYGFYSGYSQVVSKGESPEDGLSVRCLQD